MPTATAIALGPISANETYPLELFKRISGLSDWALRGSSERSENPQDWPAEICAR